MKQRRFLNPIYKALWHGGDAAPEQWPPEVWRDDIRLMKIARFKVATIGMFAWAKMEPSEGDYQFDWLDNAIEELTKGDRWFILGTPSAAPPAWLARTYPETLRTGEDRVRRLHGNRVNYNLGSPVYLEKTRAIAHELAIRYGDHPRLLAWHLSNEYNGADFGPESSAMFRQWLRRKFHNDISALNHAYWTSFWGHTFANFDEIQPPGGPYGEISIQGLTVDWQRFVTDQTVEFMLNEAALLRELSPDVPITSNLMGTYPGLDYRKFEPHLDFISWDSYPANDRRHEDPETWVATSFKHDLMRSLKPDRPWLLMEFTPSSGNWYQFMSLKRPGAHRFESLHAIAHGSDGAQYFQWRQSRGGQEQLHGGVVGHAGDEKTRTFCDVKEVGIELETHGDIAGTVLEAKVAIVFDWESRWALDAASGPTRTDKRYEETCIEHYRAFWQCGIAVDLIGLDDDLSLYRLVVAPMAYSIHTGFAKRVESFVRVGGTFVTTYLSGWVDENSLVFEGGFLAPLSEVLGVRSEELDALPPDGSNTVEVIPENDLGLEGKFAARDFFELIHCGTARVLAVYGDDFYQGRPALTVNRFGKGEAYYVASRNDRAFQAAFLPRVAMRAGVERAIDAELPPGVTVQRRVADGLEFLFVINTNPVPATVSSREHGDIQLAARDVVIISKTFAMSTRSATKAMRI